MIGNPDPLPLLSVLFLLTIDHWTEPARFQINPGMDAPVILCFNLSRSLLGSRRPY
ncbi:hypothetical protein NITMOv2_2922 [Nitrospira moscoviensis]|uniref:Uncharacterized protein n=1 Tax=Nitrospira moscoviensis TaxID=42253 RepID=A0A0K2GEF0_NITMO|nr:hypothetical protein NITMOv2_2922 [Nitrospira moscoviensis]